MNTCTFRWVRRDLDFIIPAKTSRNTLRTKPSWFLFISSNDGKTGIGECSIIPTLSLDDEAEIERELRKLEAVTSLEQINPKNYQNLPALRFGLEIMLRSYHAETPYQLFPSPFSRGEFDIPMNGLIWMDSHEGLLAQVAALVNEGFKILKMKIGAKDHEDEIRFLKDFRQRYPANEFELRVDANGAYDASNAQRRLEELAAFDIHSIEQPVKANQWKLMAELTKNSPIPIALDEELIGLKDLDSMLDTVQPQYLILKPSLIGGFEVADHLVASAEKRGIKWWATSALESNLGLNAIAQWCAVSGNELPQGLGTGRLFHNNIGSPLEVKNASLHYGNNPWEEIS